LGADDISAQWLQNRVAMQYFSVLYWLDANVYQDQEGRRGARWNTGVFMTAWRCGWTSVRWFCHNAPPGRIAEIAQHLPQEEVMELLYAAPSVVEMLKWAPDAGASLLRTLAKYRSTKRLQKTMCRLGGGGKFLFTRSNCLAEHGRVLRVARTPRMLRWLTERCRLTPSDFASVSLPWPAHRD
jgi:hypothetical protein